MVSPHGVVRVDQVQGRAIGGTVASVALGLILYLRGVRSKTSTA